MAVTLKSLKAAFEECDKTFQFCWKTLSDLKGSREASRQNDKQVVANLILFQERLAESLFSLQKLRNSITNAERLLITRKDKYNKNWFTKTMQRYSYFTKGIDYVTNMGKALGDAFAFFFYRGNLDLLEKQHFHSRIQGFVAGTGGIGELEFIRQLKHLDSRLTIYHGITHILRYGDFSFYDLHTHKIVDVAELKTKKLDDAGNYELSLTIIGVETQKKPASEVSSTIRVQEGMDQSTSERLRRQIEAILKILKPQKDQTKLSASLDGAFYFKDLIDLFNSSGHTAPIFKKFSEGLVMSGIKFPRASLMTRIYNRKISRVSNVSSDKLTEQLTVVMKSGSRLNGIVIGQLLYNPDYTDKNTPGTIPLFWYPLPIELIRSLYFSEFMVFSFFNPAHLIERFEQEGFHVSSKYIPENFKKDEKDFKKGIQHFDLLISYLMNYLQSEKSIFDSVVKAESMAREHGQTGGVMFRPQFIFDNLFEVSSP